MFAFMFTAVRSGSGKTAISTGITRAISNRGIKIVPFKAGPDYIDNIFLARAAKSASYNLDTILNDENSVKQLFVDKTAGSDGAIVEGFMGFLDGLEPKTYRGSSYHVAKTVGLPVVIILDVSGVSLTAVAIIEGLRSLSKGVEIIGVILNKVGSKKHEDMIRLAIAENMPDLLIFGAIYNDERLFVPSRAGGLEIQSDGEQSDFYDTIADAMEKYIDIDLLIKAASYSTQIPAATHLNTTKKYKVAIAYDDAFNFYYQSTWELLERYGYGKQFFSPLNNEPIPDGADLVLIGGGYIQKYLSELSKSKITIQSISDFYMNDGYIFAEGTGFNYLCKTVCIEGVDYPMAGVFDAEIDISKKRQYLGYVRATLVNDENSDGDYSSIGHMVNYSFIKNNKDGAALSVEKIYDGSKFLAGIRKRNFFGSHVHFKPDDKSSMFFLLTGLAKNGAKI